MPGNPQQTPESFYVGYLKLPPKLRGFLVALVATLFLLIAFDAWLFSSWQPASGNGKWAESPQPFMGTLVRAPYPTLYVHHDGGVRTYLIVSDEKRSADKALEKIPDGSVIQLKGHLIERAAVNMIQLGSEPVTQLADVPTIPAPGRELFGRSKLKGEIVDSKCWLGVMRPGEGHIHKACASLCIRGGIPPIFVTRDADAPPVSLMTTFDGQSIPPDKILDLVGEPVEITGLMEKRGDLYVFKVDLATLTRASKRHSN